MSLDKIKKYLDEKAGMDISQKTRRRDVVYYKKVYCKICQLLGYTLTETGKKVNLTHDNVIYHCKTCNFIYDRHRITFNELLHKYGLGEEFIMEVKKSKSLKYNKKLDYVKTLLMDLDDINLDFFIDYRLKPFLKTVK